MGLIVWDDARGRTSFAHLQQRLTAGRRLGVETAGHPAYLIVFDLLQDVRGRVLLDQTLTRRQRRPDRLLADACRCARKPATNPPPAPGGPTGRSPGPRAWS